MLPYRDKCPICRKPLPSEANLGLLRGCMLGGTVLGGVTGMAFLRFGLGGITSTGSVITTLKTLGTGNMMKFLFGSVGAGIGILTTYASLFGFCDCHHHDG